MADIICRWRNGTPKTVVELVNSLPHNKMTNVEFRQFMKNSQWGNEFFRTPYQLACQLGLYCEAEDGYFYPRFDHDITELEAEEYLEYWILRYYVPNPYVGLNGFNTIKCPTYVLFELYKYAIHHPNCTYKEAYDVIFKEKPTNNNDIVKNYINNYSKVLRYEQNGHLSVTNENPYLIFDFMDRNNKKDFFDNFSKSNKSRSNISPLQQIFYGAPGTGKSHEISKQTAGHAIIRTTFHPDSDYSTFVGCYKPSMMTADLRDASGHVIKDASYAERNKITYRFVRQAFLKAYLGAWKKYTEAGDNGAKPQFLLIEEINRGNCAQIFGDLFQLLDREDNGFSSYPVDADTDMRQEIAEAFLIDAEYKLEKDINAEGAVANYTSNYGETLSADIQSGRVLLLPPNFYIWATMNTSDQSLFPIDSAFKRRWDWKYMPIDTKKEKWDISVNGTSYSWSSFLDKINYEIGEQTSSEDKKLGFYFCKAENGVISAERFVSKVLFYLYNDVFKDYEFDRDFFKRKSDNRLITFQSLYDCQSGNVNEVIVAELLENLGVDKVEGETIANEDNH